MKLITILLFLSVAAYSYDLSKFAALVQTGTRANDAVESVYNLLRDLKTENVNMQVAADKKNATDEEIGQRVIGELTKIANINQANFDEAKSNRDRIEKLIQDTNNWINWAHNRLGEIDRKTEELQDQRCYANGLFVRSLSSHIDALEVVKLLKQDLAGYITGNAFIEKKEISNIADKLSQYSQVFHQDAIKRFSQLTISQEEDKKKGDTIGEQIFNVLVDLEADLNDTLAHLQQAEIDAARALAKWVSDSAAEKSHLRQEIEKKENALEKLNVQLPAALAAQGKANSIWKESIDALNGSMADLEEKREFYLADTERRNEENTIIDLCIQIFKEQVRNLVSGAAL